MTKEQIRKYTIGCSYSRKETHIIQGTVIQTSLGLVVRLTSIASQRGMGLDAIANQLNTLMGSFRYKQKEGWITPNKSLLIRLKNADEYWHELSLNPRKPEDEGIIEMLKDHAFSLKDQGRLIIVEGIDVTNSFCFKSYLLALKGTLSSFTGEGSTAEIYKRL